MIISGILFIFGILIGIQILYLIFSWAFWKFIIYSLPVLGLITFFVLIRDDLIIGFVIFLILSTPMFILEYKEDNKKNKDIFDEYIKWKFQNKENINDLNNFLNHLKKNNLINNNYPDDENLKKINKIISKYISR